MVSLDIRIVGIVNLKLTDYENIANPVTFQK